MARSTHDDFKVLEKIGSGSYGVVFKAVRKVDKLVYAMKEIDLQGMSRKEQEECIRETRVLSSLDCDQIIKYYDSFLERGKLYIITEYAGNGNLHDYIKKQKQKLSEELVWKLFIQILLGLNHMHSRKILHRDIKTLNVFLNEETDVKLGDMGVAKILSTNTNMAKTIVGTPYYLSPELCEDKPYNEKSDVWALGIVLYECCTQRHPFDAENQGALILKILRGKYPAVTGYSLDISDLIKRCLTQNANRRPNTFKLLMLPSIRQKAEELGIVLPDQQTLTTMAEKLALALKRPSSSRVRPAPDGSQADVLSPGSSQPSSEGGAGSVTSSDLGSTMASAQPRSNVAGSSDEGLSAPPPPPAQQGWTTTPDGGAAGAAQHMGRLGIDDDEGDGEEEEEKDNPYMNPVTYRDEEGEDGEEEEEEEGYDEGEGEGEYYEEEEEYEEEGDHGEGWQQPSPEREQHMRAALMIQKAACLDMIGEGAYAQLYELLKSNQLDEKSMTDLSRHVFKIIPYDKSEVIQMLYKLLYLESQLSEAGNLAA